MPGVCVVVTPSSCPLSPLIDPGGGDGEGVMGSLWGCIDGEMMEIQWGHDGTPWGQTGWRTGGDVLVGTSWGRFGDARGTQWHLWDSMGLC